ncbi:fibronectin type III domain-containing protein [Acidovorax sp.]|uniref:fibronectin type III domain-containing protein n=1 Tax=Acidovorax sp. TaxID=1872122 RepID=UPI003CFF2C61
MGFSSSGGLVGSGFGTGTVSNSYYATTHTGGATINNGGATDGVWFYNSYGTAATLSQLQTLFTFTTAGWDIDDAGGTNNAWRIYEGKTTPLLRNLFTDSLTITANSGSKTIDGTTAAFGVSYTPAAPDARLLGTPGAVAASSAAGTHAVNVTGVHSTQRGYDITLVPGTLTINAVVAAPDAPAAPAATPGNAQATVAWTAPASNGGSPITGYTVTGTPGGTCTVAAAAPRTCTITTLTNGTPYTFTVKATNAVGDSLASLASAPVTPTAPVVVAPPAEDPGPTSTTINTPGSTTTITNPSLPVVVGPGAGGGTIVLPGTGTTPTTLQVIVNGQPLTVQALPGTQLRIAEVNGQSVLVLVVLEGWASMASSAVGQPMVLAGPVLLSAGSAGTLVEAQPLAVAVQVGSLTAPTGSLPAVGSMGLQAGERLQVNDQGAVVAITLGSLKGETNQAGDSMAFANLPASITVDNKAFARLNGPLARLSGANMAQGLEVAPSGVFLVRDGGQVFQLLPTQPITIDARLPDGMGFTPLGLLRWVRGGVVVQFAPAVADLAGLAGAVTSALPDVTLKLGAEGVLQLRTGGQTYVLRPDWTGSGTAPGTPQIGVDEQGRIYLQTGQGARQWLLPALLNATQASSIFTTALPGAVLSVQAGSSTGALTLTLAGQAWRLVPQWVLPTGSAAQVPPQAGPWWMGADGLLYLKLGTQVQGVRVSD